MGRLVGRLLGVPVVVNTCHGLWASPGDRAAAKAPVCTAPRWWPRGSATPSCSRTPPTSHTLPPWVSRRQSAGRRQRHRPAPVRVRPGRPGRVRAELGVDGRGAGRRRRPDGRREGHPGVRRDGRTGSGRADGDRVDVRVGRPGRPGQAGRVARARATRVRFLGERTDMPAVYSALDVFVLPSYREGFSRSAMEAAACGRRWCSPTSAAAARSGDHETPPAAGAAARRRGAGRAGRAARGRHRAAAPARRRASERGRTPSSTSARRGAVARDIRRRGAPARPGLGGGAVVRRLVDMVVSGVAGVLLAPVMAVVAVLVRLATGPPGALPAAADRAGRRPFSILKFRTMRPEACAGRARRGPRHDPGPHAARAQPGRAAAAVERRARRHEPDRSPADAARAGASTTRHASTAGTPSGPASPAGRR